MKNNLGVAGAVLAVLSEQIRVLILDGKIFGGVQWSAAEMIDLFFPALLLSPSVGFPSFWCFVVVGYEGAGPLIIVCKYRFTENRYNILNC